MVVEVLKPEDCLKLPYSMKHPKNACSSPKPNRVIRTQPTRKKRFPNVSPTPRPTVGSRVVANNLVVGQVKILKRGEDLKKIAPEMPVNFGRENVDVNPDSRSTKQGAVSATTLTPFTELNNNSNRNKVDPAVFYAGSAFVTSPSPSSVPMPGFFTKKVAKVDDVTSDLRRILRLDL